jgi:prophage antirepressor-like protein
MSHLAIQQFNPTTSIRIIDNEWFVAKDVCDGLDIKDPAKAVRSIESQFVEAGIEGTISNRTLVDTAGGKQEMVAVNETGLNLLIMQSRKKEAIRFKYWIASEVLPAIRATGKYELPKETLTPEQQRHIQETVIDIAKNQGVHYQTTYHNIKTQFKVGTYKDILKTQYPDLCQFLGVMPVYDVENIPYDIPVLATMTSEQKEVIHSNLIQVMSLFNPLSEPFSKLQAVGRALKGKHPNTGSNHNGYLAVL